MARPRRIHQFILQLWQTAAATATPVDLVRRCQAVLLPGLLGATLQQTAIALGVGRATVARLQAGFRN